MGAYGRYGFPLALFLGALYFTYLVRGMLLPFILAGAVAFLLNPVVKFFEMRGARRGPVVVLLYLVLTAMATLGVYKVGVVAAREAEEAGLMMPAYVEKGRRMFADWEAASQRAQRARRRKTVLEKTPVLRTLLLDPALVDRVGRLSREWPQKILERMPSLAYGIVPALEIIVIVPFVAFFLMREGPAIRERLLAWLPSRCVEMALNLAVEIDNSLGRYVRGVCLEAFLVAGLAFAGFRLIGLDYALQIAAIVGMANIIPYVGPAAGGLVGGVVAVFQWGGFFGVFKVAAVVGCVRFIEDWFIQPYVMSQAVHLHPVWIVFALLAGAKLFGFWGLLFAVPVATMIKVLLRVLGGWYRLQYGLATPSPLSEAARIPLI